jgi:hypothetical protein
MKSTRKNSFRLGAWKLALAAALVLSGVSYFGFRNSEGI